MDDLEADIRAAMAGDAPAPAGVTDATIPGPGNEPAAPSPAPAAAEAPKTDDRVRDEHGRFVPKTEADKTAAASAPAAAAPNQPAAVTPPVAPAAPHAQPILAPQNWKGAGKVQWDKLPEAVRKEISEDYTRFADKEARLSKMEAAIGPERAQIYAAQYGSVENALQSILAGADLANKNPQGFILWLAQRSGINLAQMVGQHSAQGQQPTQQAPDPVTQRVQQLETMLTQYVQQQQQGTQTQLQTEIDRFAADPAHPYFNDVRADMALLMQGGRAKDLQQAYDMAVWAHPEIRSSLIDGQVQAKTQQQSQAAQQAINASVSVSGSPAGAKIASDEPPEDLEQVIRRAQAQHARS